MAALARRVFREVEQKGSIFDLPVRRFVRGRPEHDLSVELGGRRAAIPFGPAAGPHTQLAQNIVLSWLAGGRVLELKTVQVDDQLSIPRPCIDMRDVGLNCEWSQELRVVESLREYVKGALLVAMIAESGIAGVAPEHRATIYDASVGYDLAGVRSESVGGFLRGLRDTGPIVEELRAGLPPELRRHGEVEIPRALVNTVTLSTFHGCPPSEIEAIASHLMEAHGVGCVVKLNPTLLGAERVHALLHDALGYDELVVPAEAFERDLKLAEAVELVARLRRRAESLGLHFGVKLTNTLVVENRRDFFPASVAESYLSGPPLHVLAVDLLRTLRELVGAELPMSFSAGIDAHNVVDALTLGLAPVTVCTDWLKTGGYARGVRYAEAIHQRMDLLGARSLEALIAVGQGHAEAAIGGLGLDSATRERALVALQKGGALGDELTPAQRSRWRHEATLANTKSYAARVLEDPRYRRDHRERAPRKVGSKLTLFDCLSCDKCIPVCPNDANFSFVVPQLELPRLLVRPTPAGLRVERVGTRSIEERHQIGHYADACNDCGNCDVFCPEDGGPQLEKPRFFGTLEALSADPHGSGLYVERASDPLLVHGRFEGRAVRLTATGREAVFEGEGFRLVFDLMDPAGGVTGSASGEVELTEALVLHTLAVAVLAPREVNPIRCGELAAEATP